MKVLIVNGSPRKNGNTSHALRAVSAGLVAGKHSVELIHAADLKLRGCINCDGCKKNGGNCVLPDGGAALMDQVAAADMVLFGSPVYWWGISGQLKLFLDKFYSKDELFHEQNKKLGIIAVGAAEVSDPQYRLIREQFQCICGFLGWEFVLSESISAWGADDLAKNTERLAELERKGTLF